MLLAASRRAHRVTYYRVAQTRLQSVFVAGKERHSLMARFAFRHVRLVAPMAAAAALAISALPAAAQSVPATPSSDCSMIHFELSNPTPGAKINNSLIVSGLAQDMRASASQGSGIDKVDFFLGNRDLGGDKLGTFVTGGLVPGPFGPYSFQVNLNFPSNQKGGNDLVAYAHSMVTGQEAVIDTPIVLNMDPNDLPSPIATTATTSCLGGTPLPTGLTVSTTFASPGTPANPVTPAKSTTPPPPPVSVTVSTASTIVLDVGNPTPGTTVLRGALAVSGTAVNRGALFGSGIARVDIFLDNQDTGGLQLGTAVPDATGVWGTTVTLPSNATGGHVMYFAAHANNGAVAVTAVPITINH